MMASVCGFPIKNEPITSVAIPVRGYGWSVGSPAPMATKQGTTITLSGRFVASSVGGTGDQQNAGILPVGYRPHQDKSVYKNVTVGGVATTMQIIGWTGVLQLSLVGTMSGVLDLTGITFSTT